MLVTKYTSLDRQIYDGLHKFLVLLNKTLISEIASSYITRQKQENYNKRKYLQSVYQKLFTSEQLSVNIKLTLHSTLINLSWLLLPPPPPRQFDGDTHP
jgi:hypothetical protein